MCSRDSRQCLRAWVRGLRQCPVREELDLTVCVCVCYMYTVYSKGTCILYMSLLSVLAVMRGNTSSVILSTCTNV